MRNDAILAIDPGRDKIGIAVVRTSGEVVYHQWILAETLEKTLKEVLQRYAVHAVILGNRTYASHVQKKLSPLLPSLAVHRVEEAYSTLEARRLYWKYHSPKTMKEHLLKWLRIPAGPWDDLAAIVLAQRYLSKNS